MRGTTDQQKQPAISIKISTFTTSNSKQNKQCCCVFCSSLRLREAIHNSCHNSYTQSPGFSITAYCIAISNHILTFLMQWFTFCWMNVAMWALKKIHGTSTQVFSLTAWSELSCWFTGSWSQVTSRKSQHSSTPLQPEQRSNKPDQVQTPVWSCRASKYKMMWCPYLLQECHPAAPGRGN